MANKITFACEVGTFYACDYGSRFLGCCIDKNKERVCGEGCEYANIEPSYFDVTYFQYLESAQAVECEDGFTSNVCPEPAGGNWSFFGCYYSPENPCILGTYSKGYLGIATTPFDTDNGDPYPLNKEDLIAAESTSTLPSSIEDAAYTTLGSIPSHTHSVSASPPSTPTITPTITHNPSKATIGAVAGGFSGGLVATAALLGCAILFYRRRKTRQAKSPAPNSEPSIEESIPLTPAPAYTTTTTSSEKPIQTETQPDTVFMREIGIPDSPPRPISELSSLEQGDAASRSTATAAMVSNTGFIPYPAKRAQGQETPLTNSSGNFPHAVPGTPGVGNIA